MNKTKLRDVAVRAAKTFWQAAIGYALSAIAAGGITDIDAAKTLLFGVVASSIAAGASAAWNGVVSPLLSGGAIDE